MLNMTFVFVFGIAIGYYLGNKTARDKINSWLLKGKNNKVVCACGQTLKADIKYCPKCGKEKI